MIKIISQNRERIDYSISDIGITGYLFGKIPHNIHKIKFQKGIIECRFVVVFQKTGTGHTNLRFSSDPSKTEAGDRWAPG